MSTQFETQRIISVEPNDLIVNWVEGFLTDCRARNLSPLTNRFYRIKLAVFLKWLNSRQIFTISEITPPILREFLLTLENSAHNPGGIHAYFRTLKAFMRWYQSENDLFTWSNPINKVRAPKVSCQLLKPATLNDIHKLLDVCGNDLYGLRNRAILLTLVDTGVRASELISIKLENINLITGEVIIVHGKGNKTRVVYLGKKSRQALRKYLAIRKSENPFLFLSRYGEQLDYNGLRAIVKRIADQAGIYPPQLHSFRRFFALSMLRNGIDVFSLQLLMGHSDLQVLRRYLKQENADLQSAHNKASPVDVCKL